MTTLKQHQEAMVQLLANGSGIPASASRLAHAMHDVLEMLNLQPGDAAWRVTTYNQMQELFARTESLGGPWNDATTPGLNDRALAEDIKAVRPKQVSAEHRVKQLENTIKQLKANNRALRQEVSALRVTLEFADGITTEKQFMAEQSRLSDSAQAVKLPEQSGVRKEDTQVSPKTCMNCHAVSYRNVITCDDCGEPL